MPFLNRIGSGSTSKFGFRMGFGPGAPTAVTASLPSTYGNTTALVSWTAPVILGSPAFHDYVIQYSSDSGSTWTTFSDTVSTGTSVTVTGLTNGTAYVFRVAAVNLVATGPYSTNSNSVTPLFGKIPTPVIGDIAETTSSIPWCYTNYNDYIPVQDGGTYNYVYYDFNVNAPNDQNGACHGWTGLGENVYRSTYLKLTKTGWADSDAIFIQETTNVTPDFTPEFTPAFCVTPCSCVCCDPQNQCGFDYKYPSSGVCGDGTFCYTYP
jgi:hypothetical protein